MLKSMRSNLKSLSWTLWLVILAFIGFIFVQWGSGRFESEGLDRDVAAVGRFTISGEEFQKNLVQSLEMYSKQFKNNFSRQAINQLGIAEQVLQGMISGRIVQGEAAKLKLQVSDAELQDAIRTHPAFQRNGQFIGSEEYERLLAYNHMTVLDFENSLRKDLLANKLKELVTAGEVLDAGPAARGIPQGERQGRAGLHRHAQSTRSRKSPRSAKRSCAIFTARTRPSSRAPKKGAGKCWP